MSDLLPLIGPTLTRLLALVLLLLGTLAALRFLFRDPHRRRPRCPKCLYDHTALPSLTCPECGHTLASPARRYFTRRRYRAAIVSLAAALALPTAAVVHRVREFGWRYYTVVGPVYWLYPVDRTTLAVINGHRVVSESDRRDAFFGIPTVTVRITTPGHPDVSVSELSVERVADLPACLTGDGVPDVVLRTYSGGAHCCNGYYVYELPAAAPPRLLAFIDAADSDAEFKDLDHNGTTDIALADMTFAYWNTSFASSPAPAVVLEWDGHTFAASPRLMRRPAPSADALRQSIADLRRDTAGSSNLCEYAPMWGTMLDLIYTGHSDLAYRYLHEAWPPDHAVLYPDTGREPPFTRSAFRVALQEQLARSPYRAALEQLGHP